MPSNFPHNNRPEAGKPQGLNNDVSRFFRVGCVTVKSYVLPATMSPPPNPSGKKRRDQHISDHYKVLVSTPQRPGPATQSGQGNIGTYIFGGVGHFLKDL